jgi:hypothetical protein
LFFLRPDPVPQSIARIERVIGDGRDSIDFCKRGPGSQPESLLWLRLCGHVLDQTATQNVRSTVAQEQDRSGLRKHGRTAKHAGKGKKKGSHGGIFPG